MKLVAERKITMDYLLYEIFDVAAKGMAFSVPLIFLLAIVEIFFSKKMMTETKI
ncbi:hypothetical protein HMPREF2097_03465 [Enterococcus faecalis 918]|nr:hypothetical protein HMPREF2097_03465 [Enterococcus faecalis 918]